MTTLLLSSAAEMRTHTLLQAKRLRKRLDISLTVARNLLAQAAYRCRDWTDLQRRIAVQAGHEACLTLAQPGAEEFLVYLKRNEVAIAREIGRRILANTNLAGMLETVRYVFAQREQATVLQDIVPELRASTWTSAGIGPDPHAVIEAYVCIDGQFIKLIGTRVYLPQFMNMPEHLTQRAPFAVNIGEPLSIMWSDPRQWYDAACTYLDLPDDDESMQEFAEPEPVLDAAMRAHACWFQKLMRYWSDHGHYDIENDQFEPIVMGSGTYLVFGVPASRSRDTLPPPSAINCADGDNPRTLAHLDGHAICIESLTLDPATGRHDGEFPEHFESVRASLFQHASYRPSDSDRVYFILPATRFDIEHSLKLEMRSEPGQEAFTIKTDRIELLELILRAVVDRKVEWFTSRSGFMRYVVTMRVPTDGFDGFNAHLELRGADIWSNSNLTGVTYWGRTGTTWTVHVELHEELFALTNSLGMKAIMDAARDGIVLHRPSGFRISLKTPHKWHAHLKQASSSLIEQFECQRLPVLTSFEDLFAGWRRIKFRRDSF